MSAPERYKPANGTSERYLTDQTTNYNSLALAPGTISKSPSHTYTIGK